MIGAPPSYFGGVHKQDPAYHDTSVNSGMSSISLRPGDAGGKDDWEVDGSRKRGAQSPGCLHANDLGHVLEGQRGPDTAKRTSAEQSLGVGPTSIFRNRHDRKIFCRS